MSIQISSVRCCFLQWYYFFFKCLILLVALAGFQPCPNFSHEHTMEFWEKGTANEHKLPFISFPWASYYQISPHLAFRCLLTFQFILTYLLICWPCLSSSATIEKVQAWNFFLGEGTVTSLDFKLFGSLQTQLSYGFNKIYNFFFFWLVLIIRVCSFQLATN